MCHLLGSIRRRYRWWCAGKRMDSVHQLGSLWEMDALHLPLYWWKWPIYLPYLQSHILLTSVSNMQVVLSCLSWPTSIVFILFVCNRITFFEDNNYHACCLVYVDCVCAWKSLWTLHNIYSCFGTVDSSVVENVCTGNIWVVDNTYIRPIIGIWHHWHSSVITDCIFGVSLRKSDISELKERSNCWTLNRILTMGQSEVTKRWSLSSQISVPYATFTWSRILWLVKVEYDLSIPDCWLSMYEEFCRYDQALILIFSWGLGTRLT